MQKILLHSCCAPCSGAIIEWMLANDYEPVVFFYNPNINPREEYEKRKAELIRFCEKKHIQCIDGDYNHTLWLACVKGLENEPERGKRCDVCFRMRLTEAAKICKQLGLSTFTTSLASSRWKSLTQVDAAGEIAAQTWQVTYWAKNWRKGGLQERRNAIIKEENFYNQPWCGCEFSLRDSLQKKAQFSSEGRES